MTTVRPSEDAEAPRARMRDRDVLVVLVTSSDLLGVFHAEEAQHPG